MRTDVVVAYAVVVVFLLLLLLLPLLLLLLLLSDKRRELRCIFRTGKWKAGRIFAVVLSHYGICVHLHVRQSSA